MKKIDLTEDIFYFIRSTIIELCLINAFKINIAGIHTFVILPRVSIIDIHSEFCRREEYIYVNPKHV